jgi:outer membrane lipoprotein-sorting protein
MKNAVQKGTVDVPGVGITAQVTIYKAEPNLMLAEIDMPGMGKMIEGFDGKNAWGHNAIMGPTLKQGKEASDAKSNSEFRQEEWRAMYSKVETTGIETVEGEECYKVEVTAKSGTAMTNFYSIKSGLLLKTNAKVATEMGEIDIQTTFKDYRKVGDLVLLPFQMVSGVEGMGMTMAIKFSEIKINVDIPKSTFEPPAEVKALINK